MNKPLSADRRYPRRPIKSDVDIYYVHKRYTARSMEISQGGILIECSMPFEPRSRMSLHFTVKDKRLYSRAEVLYTIPSPGGNGLYLIGLLFLDRTYNKNDVIQSFVIEAEG